MAGEDIDGALESAADSFGWFKRNRLKRAALLDGIASELEKVRKDLMRVCMEETHLGKARLEGELTRTTGQLEMFARLVREGWYLDARIDRGNPDIRRYLVPLGPVVVFGAANFPIAFSVAGGDTASALAAGCPVVMKAHPAHPKTSRVAADAIAAALAGMEKDAEREAGGGAQNETQEKAQDGVFTLIYGASTQVGKALVLHPKTKAVAFTGSFSGGRALHDLCASREVPIPFFGEMGSVNPVFLLPGAVKKRGREIASGLANSATLGVGQFCTQPGIAVAVDTPELHSFIDEAADVFSETPKGAMLTDDIANNFSQGAAGLMGRTGVEPAGETASAAEPPVPGKPLLVKTTGKIFLSDPALKQEVFGPVTLLVVAENSAELRQIAASFQGELTASVFGEEEELIRETELLDLLTERAGRVICNGFPTGVRVCHSMQHGGPFPATTNSRETSVGTAAIKRFLRPVCFQDCPDDLLPEELKNENPSKILRLVDGVWTTSRA
jgi:NADP-dependent aldehyde dehydrogenase